MLTNIFGMALIAGCASTPIHFSGENVAERYTVDPPSIAFPKMLEAAQRVQILVLASNPQAGTFQGTAYRGRVAVFFHMDTHRGQTRLGAVARLEPGTFSHGDLTLADRLLAAYREGA